MVWDRLQFQAWYIKNTTAFSWNPIFTYLNPIRDLITMPESFHLDILDSLDDV
jgi:hypothetical protein